VSYGYERRCENRPRNGGYFNEDIGGRQLGALNLRPDQIRKDEVGPGLAIGNLQGIART
jgi:hypothetical protein